MSIIFRETFETDGNGIRYVTSVDEFSDGFGDFFTRTDGTNIGSFYSVTGQEGSSWFAVMDTNGEPQGDATVTLSIGGIDINGVRDLQVSGLFAEDDDGSNQDWDADARVHVEAQIDGGGYFKVLQFAAQGATNTEPGLDSDFDGVADGALLSGSFARFAADITGMGALLDLRITFENLEAGDEDISIDDITVSGTLAPSQVSVLNENFDTAAGFSVNTPFFADSFGDFFGISDGAGGGDFGDAGAPAGIKPYGGTTGSFLTGMDLNGEGASLPIEVTWQDLDIAGLDNLRFSGDFGEFFDSPGDIDASDYIELLASIDGGPEQTVLSFRGADFNSGSFNGIFRQDTDGDGVGDGAALGDTLANFAAAIDGTGTRLDLKLRVSVEAGDEDFAVDNFQITGTSGATPSPAVIARSDNGVLVDEDQSLTDSFTVELATIPTDPVALTISAPDNQSLVSLDGTSFAPSLMLYLADTTPISIQVRAQDDTLDESATHDGALSFVVNSADPAYDGLSVTDLSVEILDNDTSLTRISQIQGTGDSSSMVDQEVTVEAIVTGLITTSNGVTGFFLQEEDTDRDADATTSEGIYVYLPDATVAVGDKIRLSGTVGEYRDQTQISSIRDLQTLDTGVTLPTVTQITIGMSADFEAYESMRVELITGSEDPLSVITNFNLDRFGEVVVAEGNQIQPTQIFDPETQATEIAALRAQNMANRLTIDDGSTAQNPDIYRLIDSGDGTPLAAGDPLDAQGPTLRLGSELSAITGVLDERFGGYRLQADGPLQPISGTNARPAAPEIEGELKVASFNVLNYFTTLDTNSNGTGPNGDLDPRGASTAQDLARQTQKIVAALAEIDADIIGLQEIENNGFGEDSAIAALVDALNAELGEGTYAYVDPGVAFVGSDAITTGMIYKPASVTLTGAATLEFVEASAAQTYAIASELNAYASSDDQVGNFDRNRPATAATFRDTDGNELTVVTNHFKSKGDSNLQDVVQDARNAGAPQALIDALLADPNYDQGDGQGFWNQVRADAGAELVAWLDTNPTGAGSTENTVILGDLNAYAQEDPVQTITDAGYSDLAAEFIGEDAYSFVFDGQRGTLDYGLASSALLDNITHVAEWHSNADEPDLLNYNSRFSNPAFFNDDPYAASDHDPLIIGLNLADDDPTGVVMARLDFSDLSRLDAIASYSENGTLVATSELPRKSYDPITPNGSGLTLIADDDTAKAVQFRTTGDGLAINSLVGDRQNRTDRERIDESETLTVTLTNTLSAGDGLGVAFDLLNVSGEGQVMLRFFLDGTEVDSTALSPVDGRVSHDLQQGLSFDSVEFGMTGGLKAEIDALDLKRIELDTAPAPALIASRLDIDAVSSNQATASYSELGTLVEISDLPRSSNRDIVLETSGIIISAEDGTEGREQLRTFGSGLSVRSVTGDSDDATDRNRLDDDETITFSLTDTGIAGNAVDVGFDFVNVSGEGQVALSFFDDCTLVDEILLDISDNRVDYDLAGDLDFDQVMLGVTGDLALEVDALDMNRLNLDYDNPLLG